MRYVYCPTILIYLYKTTKCIASVSNKASIIFMMETVSNIHSFATNTFLQTIR